MSYEEYWNEPSFEPYDPERDGERLERALRAGDTSPAEFFGPNARTLVGLSGRNDVLWIVAVERAATQGVTLPQAAQLMIQLSAATALTNMPIGWAS